MKINRKVKGAAVAVAAASALVSGAGTANAGPIWSVYNIQIRHVSNDYCLMANSVRNGGGVWTANCNGSLLQRWDIVSTNATYQLRNEGTGQCLAFDWADNGLGMMSCDYRVQNQQFTVTLPLSGSLQFNNFNSCLDGNNWGAIYRTAGPCSGSNPYQTWYED